MPAYLCLKDSRLDGVVVERGDLSVQRTGPNSSLVESFARIKSYKNLSCLFIACHGFELAKGTGGLGSELGKEGVYISNVNYWIAINGICQNIVIYACRAADISDVSEYKTSASWLAKFPYFGNGPVLLSKLACFTGANVFASNANQYYANELKIIDFGAWEGGLFKFAPDGGMSCVNASPYELSTVSSAPISLRQYMKARW